jgi:hypothetical protein
MIHHSQANNQQSKKMAHRMIENILNDALGLIGKIYKELK